TEIYTAAPEIKGISPARGPARGGSQVVITGFGLAGASAVKFGGVPTSFSVDSPTQITATVPAHPRGITEVTVTSEAGGSSQRFPPNPAATFTYVAQPGTVTDLVATAVSDSEIVLEFTAPDNGSTAAPATSYVVKQSASAIVGEAAFDAAQALCGQVCVVAPGERVRLGVGDLAAGQEYHYAIRAVSEFGDLGDISNSASATPGVAGVNRLCPSVPGGDPTGIVFARGYSLLGVPDGTTLAADGPLYSWLDLGAGGAYATAGHGRLDRRPWLLGLVRLPPPGGPRRRLNLSGAALGGLPRLHGGQPLRFGSRQRDRP
ncbi:MAG TPA: IPT/TIG domain-containing protein, partial [Acidimicrobiales bacterium]|nr:IPT/TIG domain-containing protein [Acidimicrobiales bacterium]